MRHILYIEGITIGLHDVPVIRLEEWVRGGVRLFSAVESLPAASPNFVKVLIFKWTKALKLKLPSVVGIAK